MTDNLLQHLDLIAAAPDGVKRLRELILELAVRGKLVPQDSNDEPASELLKRIQAEKSRLVAEGKIKKDKPLPAIGEEEKPFDLPMGWEWVRLANVVAVLNGRAYSKDELLDRGTPVLRVGNLFTSNHWYYSDLLLEEDKYCDAGDLIFSWSASFGPFIWQGPKVIYHYHIWKLQPFREADTCREFLNKFLLEKTQEIKSAGHGVSMIHMTKEKMEKVVVPLPPLPEQHRIVAKVDELMALCDQLEARETEGGKAHATLVKTLLDTLTAPSQVSGGTGTVRPDRFPKPVRSDSGVPSAPSRMDGDFTRHWERIARHFDTLFTTEASIDALKQTILQLAVMGKLVPQNPDDEPASELLKRIQAEKAKLIAEGKIRKDKPLPAIGEEEKPFELPAGWEWVR
jgi:type I restriction enzyme S subunit